MVCIIYNADTFGKLIKGKPSVVNCIFNLYKVSHENVSTFTKCRVNLYKVSLRNEYKNHND